MDNALTETKESIDQPHSVEISINSKGMYSGKVKTYATSIDEAYRQTLLYAEKLENVISLKNTK